MNQSFIRASSFVILFLTASLSGTILIVLNPSRFWDDWVWSLQAPSDLVKVGVEMGAWWSGHLSAIIYALPNSTLAMRITALVAWLLAAAAFALVSYRAHLVTKSEAFVALLLLASSHAGLMRFWTSAAMYNVFIASFWIAWALLVIDRTRSAMRLAAAVAFLFAFHLNSLIFLYGVFILWLLATAPEFSILKGAVKNTEGLGLSTKFPSATYKLMTSNEMISYLNQAIRKNFIFFMLPVLFLLVVKVPSIILNQSIPDAQNVYSEYNSVKPSAVFSAIGRTLIEIQPLFADYVLGPLKIKRPTLALCLFALYAVQLMLAYRSKRRSSLRTIAWLASAGVILMFAGLYPYMLVGKPPKLNDVYEGRHSLVAVPGIVLLIIASIAAVVRAIPVRYAGAIPYVRNALIAFVLAMSSTHSAAFALDLLRDWTRQAAITNFVSLNSKKFKDVSTLIFDDKTLGFRIGNRNVWNYEYTGNVIHALKEKKYLGVSFDEYMSWPINVPLIKEEYFRKRYNLDYYDFRKQHLVIEMTNGTVLPKDSFVTKILGKYWSGREIASDLIGTINFSVSAEYVESERRMADMNRIVKVIEAYKAAYGYYPINATNVVPAETAFGRIRTLTLSAPTRPNIDVWTSLLAPEFINEEQLIADCSVPDCGYLYISDGVDYKLVYKNPQDLPYARQAFGSHMDPRRNAYGTWTPGAVGW